MNSIETEFVQQHIQRRGIERVTYLSLKSAYIEKFGEEKWVKQKLQIQKLLQTSTNRNRVSTSVIPAVQSIDNAQKRAYNRRTRPPSAARLYMFDPKANSSALGDSEGNRFITNDDL